LDNGLGLTPPLAYSVWNFFAIGANETHMLETARALESTGLKALGYDTIALDAGSIASRDPVTHSLVASKHRFPSGLRALSDELHSRGFKFGGYTDLSGHTCGNGPNTGSLGHYQLDAKTFALDWQIDYLKVDFCGFRFREHGAQDPRCVPVDAAQQYAQWAALWDAFNKTGRPIYLSICPHAVASGAGTEVPKDAIIYAPPAEWTRDDRHRLANSLLVEYDNAFDAWLLREASDGQPGAGLIYNIDAILQVTRLVYSAPGSWDDGDMLQVSYGLVAQQHGYVFLGSSN
jgi:alpha-galactosidase